MVCALSLSCQNGTGYCLYTIIHNYYIILNKYCNLISKKSTYSLTGLCQVLYTCRKVLSLCSLHTLYADPQPGTRPGCCGLTRFSLSLSLTHTHPSISIFLSFSFLLKNKTRVINQTALQLTPAPLHHVVCPAGALCASPTLSAMHHIYLLEP